MFVLCAVALSATIRCDTAECIEETNARTSYKKGDLIKVWATLEGPGYKKYIRWFAEVDKLSILEIADPDCEFSNLNESTIEMSTNFGSASIVPYRSPEDDTVVPEFYSMLVFMNEGIGSELRWDTNLDVNSCRTRRPSIVPTCYMKESEGQCTEETKKIKIFTGFVGSDNTGEPFLSAGEMPSTFMKFGVNGVVDDAIDFFA